MFKLSGEKVTSCKEILVGLWSYTGRSGGKANHGVRGARGGMHFSFIYVGRVFVSFWFSKLAMRYSREAQGAGDTSASFTLDFFLPAFGFQSQR